MKKNIGMYLNNSIDLEHIERIDKFILEDELNQGTYNTENKIVLEDLHDGRYFDNENNKIYQAVWEVEETNISDKIEYEYIKHLGYIQIG